MSRDNSNTPEVLLREALEKIEDFANRYNDVGGICYKIARDALRAVDALPSEKGESDAWARLRAVQKRLVDAGVRDVKFHFAIGPETPASKVASDAADLLEAHLTNATGAVCGPLPVTGHKTASVDAADERTPEEAAHPFPDDKQETPRTDELRERLKLPQCSMMETAEFELFTLARQLERELVDAQQRINEWRDLCEKYDSLPSAILPHDLIYKLHEWTRQIAEQPPHRVSPGIANAAQRLHEELQLYVKQK